MPSVSFPLTIIQHKVEISKVRKKMKIYTEEELRGPN